MQQPGASDADLGSPWLAASHRFVQNLPDDERRLYENANLENIFYVTSNAQRSHEEQSYTRLLSRKLAPLTDALEDYGQALDVFSNSFSLYICPVWGALRVVLCGLQNFQKYCAKVADHLEHIGDILPRLRSYRHLFPQDLSLFLSLTSAYLVILTSCCEINETFLKPSRHAATRILLKRSWKTCEPRLDGLLKDLRRHKEEVEQRVQIVHMQHEKQFRDRADAFQQTQLMRQEESDRFMLMRMLSDDNYQHKHASIQEMRHPQTCHWLLEEPVFQNWASSTENSCFILWGIPGCGKTVIACHAIEQLREHGALCYYYFDHANLQSLKIASILRACIRQLLEPRDIPASLKAQIRNLASRDRLYIVQNLLELLVTVTMQLQRCIIVLDGFDELSQSDRATLKKAVRKILSEAKTTKIFLTCRQGSENGFPNSTTLGITQDKVAADLDKYTRDSVEEAISKEEADNKLTLRDPTLKAKINETLLQKADGMFLLVKYQLLEICSAQTDTEVHCILANLPSTLVEAYDRILARIQTMTNGAEYLSGARRILMWVTCARRPLTLDELREGVALSPNDTRFPWQAVVDDDEKLLYGCRAMLLVDHSRRIVQLAHATIKEYLCASDSRFRLDSDSEEYIGRTCIQYLSLSDFQQQVTTFKPQYVSVNTKLLSDATYDSFPSTSRLVKWLYEKFWQTQTRSNNYVHDISAKQQIGVDGVDFHAYALLGYITDYWHAHVNEVELNHDDNLLDGLQKLVFEDILPFAFKPWTRPVHVASIYTIQVHHPEGVFANMEDEALWLWIVDNGNNALCQAYLKRYPQGLVWKRLFSKTGQDTGYIRRLLQLVCRMGYIRLYWTIVGRDGTTVLDLWKQPFRCLELVNCAAEHSKDMLEAVWSFAPPTTDFWMLVFRQSSGDAATILCNVAQSKSRPVLDAMLNFVASKTDEYPAWMIWCSNLLRTGSSPKLFEPLMIAAIANGSPALLLLTLEHNPIRAACNNAERYCRHILNEEGMDTATAVDTFVPEYGTSEFLNRATMTSICLCILSVARHGDEKGLGNIFETLSPECRSTTHPARPQKTPHKPGQCVFGDTAIDFSSCIGLLAFVTIVIGRLNSVLREWTPSGKNSKDLRIRPCPECIYSMKAKLHKPSVFALTRYWSNQLCELVASWNVSIDCYVARLETLLIYNAWHRETLSRSLCHSRPWQAEAETAIKIETSHDARKVVSLLCDHGLLDSHEQISDLVQTAFSAGSVLVLEFLMHRFPRIREYIRYNSSREMVACAPSSSRLSLLISGYNDASSRYLAIEKRTTIEVTVEPNPTYHDIGRGRTVSCSCNADD